MRSAPPSIKQPRRDESHPPRVGSKLGIAISTIGKLPINGLRHTPTDGTNGWYIWCGEELSVDDEFFQPLHVEHISEKLPEVAQYLRLAPGFRFLIDGKGYEHVWYDEALLQEEK